MNRYKEFLDFVYRCSLYDIYFEEGDYYELMDWFIKTPLD